MGRGREGTGGERLSEAKGLRDPRASRLGSQSPTRGAPGDGSGPTRSHSEETDEGFPEDRDSCHHGSLEVKIFLDHLLFSLAPARYLGHSVHSVLTRPADRPSSPAPYGAEPSPRGSGKECETKERERSKGVSTGDARGRPTTSSGNGRTLGTLTTHRHTHVPPRGPSVDSPLLSSLPHEGRVKTRFGL